MKRRITIEVDEDVWNAHEKQRRDIGGLVRIGGFLVDIIGPMRRDAQRTSGARNAKQYGVTLIKDEQI